jgi:UDPglucose 6-dehydrogenase
MKIYFAGIGLAARTLSWAAEKRGFTLTNRPQDAQLAFIAEDTPTNFEGVRDLAGIRQLAEYVWTQVSCPVVLSSQVPPGFTRSLNMPIYHQAETLRVKDAKVRALNPEQHIVGCADPGVSLPKSYLNYLTRFPCPVFKMSYESAEFAKIAINMTLAAQVENTNRLADAANICGANWQQITRVLQHDRRIGPHAYLVPGRWRDSPHLLRDHVTLEAILQ